MQKLGNARLSGLIIRLYVILELYLMYRLLMLLREGNCRILIDQRVYFVDVLLLLHRVVGEGERVLLFRDSWFGRV